MFKAILSVLLFVAVPMAADAQTVVTDSVEQSSAVNAGHHLKNLQKSLDKRLTTRYFNTKYDTNYVARPDQKWLLRLMFNQTGNYIHAKGTVNDVWSRYDLHTKMKTTVGLKVSYCGIAVALSLNPSKIWGDYDDYEFNFEYHGQQFSLDVGYQRSTSLAGDMKLGDINHLNEDGLRMNVVNLAAYYVFNSRRFSFPAAMCQNYYQRQSAGSWLAGASFQGGSIKTTDELRERSPQAPEVRLSFANVALGGGYGYNLVLGRRSQWLIHLSALPTVAVYKHNKLTVNGMEKRDNRINLNMIFNERAAVIYQFLPRMFAGANLIMSNSVFDNHVVDIKQNKIMGHTFIGLRF